MERSTDPENSILATKTFYGPSISTKFKNKRCNKSKNSGASELAPYELTRLLGPSSTWQVFKKQAEVLSFVKGNKSGLMPFVFQQTNGERLFLAAHPRWLWYYDSKKDPSVRCSYEIISEYTVCKLYFDLEFETKHNQSNNGALMVDYFINIVVFYVRFIWKLVIDRSCVIDLDSSTVTKFSRHLIFNLPNAAFCNNYSVGQFVKYVCNEIRGCIEQIENNPAYKNNFMCECNLEGNSVKLLKVTDSKNKCKLFCDEGVYTKNRHFRVFKSTKLGKNAPLILSKENVYKIDNSLKNEEQIFLDSLITYVPNDNVKILQFKIDEKSSDNCSKGISPKFTVNENLSVSPFPVIDQFISSIVHPGRIFRINYFQTSNIIAYDIIGNRYCGNIGRQHKSNNVKQIVDLNSHCFYQKCYDPECATYRSPPNKLPPEIEFYLHDDLDNYFSESDISFESTLSVHDLTDNELVNIVDVIENTL